MMSASRDRQGLLKKIKQVLLRLAVIEKEQNKVVEDLDNYLMDHVTGAIQNLSKYLSSEEVKARFISWTPDEVPSAEDAWEVTEDKIMKVLSRRLHDIIEQWEEDNQVFSNARESAVQYFKQRYNLVEEELQNFQGTVAAGCVDAPRNAPLNSGMTMGEKIALGITSPIWFPIGLFTLVVGAPAVSVKAIKEKIESKMKIKKYEADKCAFMARKSAKYLDAAKNEHALQAFVKDQLEDAKLCLKQIKSRIPKLIQADKKLCEELVNETRSQKELEDLYKPIMEEGSRLRGQLAVFGIREVRANEISSEELAWEEDTPSLLGCSKFAAVYHGTMRRQGVVQQVALKVYNDVLDAKNASLIKADVERLR